MAAPKKTKTTTAKKTAKPKTAPAKKPSAPKTAPAAKPAVSQDAVQEIVTTVRGFQVNTLVALVLAVAFLLFILFPDTRYLWWLNIPAAAVSGYLFWHQGNVTKDVEQKVCRYGLLIVALLFIGRDISISNDLRDVAEFADFMN